MNRTSDWIVPLVSDTESKPIPPVRQTVASAEAGDGLNCAWLSRRDAPAGLSRPNGAKARATLGKLHETLSELERWIVDNLKTDLRVEALAERVHMSPRNFARVYTRKRGRTPAKAVEAIRIDEARRRLEETDDRIASIAEECGFSSEEQMRSAFSRVLKIPPRDYRKQFCAPSNAGVGRGDSE